MSGHLARNSYRTASHCTIRMPDKHAFAGAPLKTTSPWGNFTIVSAGAGDLYVRLHVAR
jgi:hypothetical protein